MPSFSHDVPQLLLPNRVWKCVSTISFRIYTRKVLLIVIFLFNYDSSYKSSFFTLNMISDLLSSTVLANKLKFFVSCNIKITRTSFFLLYVLICTFLYKNLVVLLHGDNNFLFWHLYSHFQQLSQRWRNDNLSLDVCYNFVLIKNITSSMFNFFLIKISCLREKKNNRETLEKHVSWKNHSVIAKYLGY